MMRPQAPPSGWGTPAGRPQGAAGDYGPPSPFQQQQVTPFGRPPAQQQGTPYSQHGPPPPQQQGPPYPQQAPPHFGPPRPQSVPGQYPGAPPASAPPGAGPYGGGPQGPAPVNQTPPTAQWMGVSDGRQQGFMAEGAATQRPGPAPSMAGPAHPPPQPGGAAGMPRGPPPGSTPLQPGGPIGTMPPGVRPMGGPGAPPPRHPPPSYVAMQQRAPGQGAPAGVGVGLGPTATSSIPNGPLAPPRGMMTAVGHTPPPSMAQGSGPGSASWGPPPASGAGLPGGGSHVSAPALQQPSPSGHPSASAPGGPSSTPVNPFFRPPPMGPPGPPPGPPGPPGSRTMVGNAAWSGGAMAPPPPASSFGSDQGGGIHGSSAPAPLAPPFSSPPPQSYPPYGSSLQPPPIKQMEQMSLGPSSSPMPPPLHSMGGQQGAMSSAAAMGPPPSTQQQQSMPPPMGPGPGLASARRVYPDPYNTGVTTALPNSSAGLGVAHSPVQGSLSSQMTSASRIDPNSIPRPQQAQSSVVYETRANGMATLPPPAISHFVVKDTGNCSPRVMRCTLNQIPVTEELLIKSAMPLALMVQPLALPDPEEEPIHVVDFGEAGPVRCTRCKAYMNPFMTFLDSGRRFQCNLCGCMNDTPRSYFCNVGPDMRRRDADERPELCKGTVEYVATPEYMVRPPMAATYFFLIDVSMNAVSNGLTAAVCNAIARCLDDFPSSTQTMIGIATFDSTIHFYNLNPSLSQPAMLVVPDVRNVYTPQPSDLIVPLQKCRHHVLALLENIPSMFQNTRVPDTALGAAVQGAYLALKSTGGRLLAFQSVLPSLGIGSLSAREMEGKSSFHAGEKEAHKLLLPADPTFKKMAIEFAEFQVSVDLFVATQAYVDVASLAVLPRTTGGQMYFYFPFTAAIDSAKIYNDLRWNITRPQGLEAVMRVRCSQGLTVQDYHGNFCKRIPTDVDLPVIDCDKTIMVTFKHDDKFQDGQEACFQCALLYTTVEGQRRIRVHTLSLTCTSVLTNLFRLADLDAQFTYFLKQVGEEVPSTPLGTVRENIVNHCVSILHSYRKHCATSTSTGQLILPEALKLLPLYTLALQKSIGLRADVRIDERSYWLARVSCLSAALSIPFVYPRMFAVQDLPPKEEDASGRVTLPPQVPLSSEKLDHEGIFLLENGEDAFLWAGKAVNADRLYHLFGVQSVDDITPGQFVLQQYDNEHSKRLHEVLNEIRRQRCSYLRLRFLRRGDPLESLFFSSLVEDKTQGSMSYVEFLCHVHRQIQNKLGSN